MKKKPDAIEAAENPEGKDETIRQLNAVISQQNSIITNQNAVISAYRISLLDLAVSVQQKK